MSRYRSLGAAVLAEALIELGEVCLQASESEEAIASFRAAVALVEEDDGDLYPRAHQLLHVAISAQR